MQTPIRLSQRISRINVSATMKAAADAAKMRQRGLDVVDLGPGEPDFPTPSNVKQAAIRAIQEDFTRYTAAGGTPELREAVCARHAEDFGTSYTLSECVISSGAKHAIFNVLQCLLDPGDEVIIPVPYWVTYRDIVEYCGGTCVFAETRPEEDFALTAALVEQRISRKTRALIVNSPCNPTGHVIPEEEFRRIYRLAAKNGFWLITDECYSRLVYDGLPFSAAAVPGARSTVIVIGSLSKTYAMTGWRIGYALAPPAVAAAVAKLQSQSTSNPASISQKAAVEALRGGQDSVDRMLMEYRRRRSTALNLLRSIPGVHCHEPQGAFYLYPDISAHLGKNGVKTPAQFAEQLLERYRVAVVPGEAFGTGRHIRVTFAVSEQELEKGVARIAEFVAGLK